MKTLYLIPDKLSFHSNSLQGIFWMLMMCIVSSLNDILVKYVGSHLPGTEIAFFRFFFSAIVLLPLMLIYGKKAFVTRYSGIQFIRAFLLVVAVSTWCYGIAVLPLTMATTIGFTTPFFVLPLAKIFLNEEVGWQRWAAAFFGFLGIMAILRPLPIDSFNPMVLALIASTVLFASLDIINKKLLLKNENFLPMLFYSALGSTLLGFFPAFLTWKTPTTLEFFFLFILGGGANLILFCVLKAYTVTEVSAIQAFRYFELILSGICGMIIFQELPTLSTLLGIAIVVPTTLYISIHETRQQKKKALEKEFEIKQAA